MTLTTGSLRSGIAAIAATLEDQYEALNVLDLSTKRFSRPLAKLVRSAVANAEEKNARHKAGVDVDNLYVKTLNVDQGKHDWRIRPRAMGRAFWIKKVSSHVTLVLDER